MKTNSMITALLALFLLAGCKNAEGTAEPNNEAPKDSLTTLSEEALLDTVQKQTLKYFWDYAEPNSGMARERFHSDCNYHKNDANEVTTGGSGFGLMSMVAGIVREFIPRNSAIARLDMIVDFLADSVRYHGAWAHWIYGD